MSNPALEQASQILGDLLARMGLEAEVRTIDEDPPMLAIELEDPGNLIGPRGEGIRSLQHLVRLILIRKEIDLPVVIDIDGYRAKKEEQLKELAEQKAEQVRTSGRLAVLSPMSSYERRVVHMALRDVEDLITESLGEGQNRRVMIKKK
jgi:spoIIIJ-associated protein